MHASFHISSKRHAGLQKMKSTVVSLKKLQRCDELILRKQIEGDLATRTILSISRMNCLTQFSNTWGWRKLPFTNGCSINLLTGDITLQNTITVKGRPEYCPSELYCFLLYSKYSRKTRKSLRLFKTWGIKHAWTKN